MIKDSSGYCILVVEDNLGDFTLIEDFLFEQFDAPIIAHAESFRVAASFLSAENCLYDVILLDLSLPDKTGEPLIHEVVKLCRNIPIIVLTGYADFSFGLKSLSLGIADYILKDELTSLLLYKSIVYSSERKKSIVALQESEKKYSELFHLSPLPMWVVDLGSLKFLDVNQATIDHYGYSREEFSSMTLKDIRPEDEIANLEQGLAADKQYPGENSRRVMIHQMKSGELRNVEIQVAAVQYKQTQASMVIATDITERLNYIQAIEDQNEKLKEISWIQSHIIRAPLSRIMGLIPLIKEKNGGSDEQDKMLDYLVLSANELDEVIKNITDKTRMADYQILPK
jgi:PAS domain S-box-containing protein